MNTYWLLESFKKNDSDSVQGLYWRQPGELDSKNSDSGMSGHEERKPGTSKKTSAEYFDKEGLGTSYKKKQTKSTIRKETTVVPCTQEVQKSVFEAEMWGYTSGEQ